MASVTLVNLNQIRVPLVAPYALDVLASTLTAAGHDVELLDLNVADDPIAAIAAYFRAHTPDLVALTLRNTGDLYFPSMLDLPNGGSCLGDHERLIRAIREWMPEGRIVIGGVGFSHNPVPLLQRFNLRCGVVGPGELVLSELATAMEESGDVANALPHRRLPAPPEVTLLRSPAGRIASGVRRSFVDNRRYYDGGGLAGIRTSNGCSQSCSYCIEPLAKGSVYTRGTIDAVLDEIDQLVDAGINDIHTCDSEFNMPFPHAKQVLRGIIGRGYPRRLRFWAYCQPRPFDEEFARLLAQSNFVGVNFGVDHTDRGILRLLGKTWYTLDDIRESTQLCHYYGIAVNHELLFGYPGDSPDAMFRAVDALMALEARAMGVVIGLAVLPGTALARKYQRALASGGSLAGFHASGEPLVDPTFFVDPSFDIPDVFDTLRAHVGSEAARIMLPQSNSRSGSTNQLVGSVRVQQDLLSGKRGAYWYHFPERDDELAPVAAAEDSWEALPVPGGGAPAVV